MIDWFDLNPQVIHVMDFIEFNNVFLLNYFLIIFIVYFSTNSILKNKIKKWTCQTDKPGTWTSTSNLWTELLTLVGL